MKQGLFTIAFLLFGVLLFGQDIGIVERKTFDEVGVNATELLAQVLKIPDDSAFLAKQTYLLTYKFSFKNYAIRFGGGIDFDDTQSKSDGFTDVTSKSSLKYDLRLGFERQIPLYNRWIGYLGLDAVFGYSALKDIADSGFDKITKLESRSYVGFGPVLGLQFNLSKRLSFATETSLLYRVFEGEKKTFFENSPQFNSVKELVSGSTVKYNFPSSIYIIYRI